MPDEDLSKRLECSKCEGNKHFQASNHEAAIVAYTQGIQLFESDQSVDQNLMATLLSNRAACYLTLGSLLKCVDDCTLALSMVKDDMIRAKILYRRAKAWFLLTDTPSSTKAMLQDAAKDLLQLLSFDPKNGPAGTLLKAIRAKHDLTKGTPISQTLDLVRAARNEEELSKQFNTLLGLLTDDEKAAPLEFGRRGGVKSMLDFKSAKALKILCCASSNPKFVRVYGGEISQSHLAQWMQNEEAEDFKMACLSLWLRLVLYLDPLDSQDTLSLVDDNMLLQSCLTCFKDSSLLPVALDVLSTWTATNRQAIVIASTSESVLKKHTESELRRMKPREVALIKKVEYQLLKRDKEWANRRAIFFCQEGGLKKLLEDCALVQNHGLLKHVGVSLGRILSSIEAHDNAREVVKHVLGDNTISIELIDESKENNEIDRERLIKLKARTQLVLSLLIGQPDVGAWALNQIREEIPDLIVSNDLAAMAVASELISAAASVEKARPTVSSLFNNGSIGPLLEHSEQSIRSGAASAVAKLGMADKNLEANDGDIMELLHIASDLLYDNESPAPISELIFTSASAAPSTSVERGIELLAYLSSKTQVKEELAHGFKSRFDSKQSTLERLVELSNTKHAGESVSAYALATVFSLIAVSNETLRKEAFAGKEITMEQYDELQALGKTEDEKELVASVPDDDPNAVAERIRKLAIANVPQAMIKLTEGANETTLEKLSVGLNRMAAEVSARGLLIQQGVLSAFIKFEYTENSSDVKKNSVRAARQCIARLLVSTNPCILTTSQRLGAIKPSIQLIGDLNASDLQRFEALLAITNLATSGNDAKEKIISEKGLSTMKYAMFSDHPMVRRAGTEAMCNLVPHPEFIKHLSDPENLRLWLAFASDYEANFECARAASGCLAMSTDFEEIASLLVRLKSFKESMTALIESGNLELMHRALTVIQNLLDHGGKCKQEVIEAGLVAFCRAYVDSYHDGTLASDLRFTKEQQNLINITMSLAKAIVTQGI